MTGWYAMRRGAHDHHLFRHQPERFFVWSWMLATAAWKDTRQDVNGKTVIVKRGQLLTSYRQMERATGVGVKVIRNLIARLKTEHAVGIDKGTGRLLITICNYDKYQAGLAEGAQAGAHEGHSKGTQKNKGTREQVIPVGESDDSEPVQVSILSKVLWDTSIRFLRMHGVEEAKARPLIGRWRKVAEDTAILAAIEAAHKAGTQDPIPYITEALKGKPNGKSSKQEERLNAFIAGARGTP